MSNSENKLDVEDKDGNIYQIDFSEIQKASLTLHALNNKTRHRVFQLIQDDGPLTASDIQSKFGASTIGIR